MTPDVLATNISDYPTPWQRKVMWAALTAFCVVLLIVIIGTMIWASANIISFLQPILIPVAIALILACLLDPLVTKMSQGSLSRTKAVALIFTIAFLAIGGLVAWVVPTISVQSANFAREVPAYTQKARDRIVDLIVQYNRIFSSSAGTHGKAASPASSLVNLLLGTPPPRGQPTATPGGTSPPPPAVTGATPSETIAAAPAKITSADRQRIQAQVEKEIPNLERYL